jgi:glc operon protein GlcG
MQITASGAEKAMNAAEAEAAANGWSVTICISDAGGVPIMVKRINAFPASYDIAVGKAKSAALFIKDTALLESAVNVAEGNSRTAMLSSPFVLMRGGVPFVVNGTCCGAVGVSGVKPDEDEQVAKAAIAALEASVSKL